MRLLPPHCSLGTLTVISLQVSAIFTLFRAVGVSWVNIQVSQPCWDLPEPAHLSPWSGFIKAQLNTTTSTCCNSSPGSSWESNYSQQNTTRPSNTSDTDQKEPCQDVTTEFFFFYSWTKLSLQMAFLVLFSPSFTTPHLDFTLKTLHLVQQGSPPAYMFMTERNVALPFALSQCGAE